MIKTALISVSEKKGVAEFASQLAKLGVKIISTGGTAKVLKKAGVPVVQISDYTGMPEMMDGRVKTLHPMIHAGILADRSNKSHMQQLKKSRISPIDLVVVNLYPFEETITRTTTRLHEAIEQIDIGGPTILRAAAKNFESVVVVVDPSDYSTVLAEIKKGDVERVLRRKLAEKVFKHTSHYDSIIYNYLETREDFPPVLEMHFDKVEDLRYGENPYQEAAFYKDTRMFEPCVATAKQLHGKKLSYNNILDVNHALELVKEFKEPCAAVIKHTNPCGVAVASTIEKAYRKAHSSDPMSAFGSIVALNRRCTYRLAKDISRYFVEVVVCPKFDKKALELLGKKKNIRLLETGKLKKTNKGYDLKKVVGGLLLQKRTFPNIRPKAFKVVTKKRPSKRQMDDMVFALKVCRHVKSNSIIYAKNGVAIGIGAGQMSRVDSARIAATKAAKAAKGAVMASDAFFPFRDGIDAAAKAGISAVIQPGGSIRDQEVIDAADEHKMSMIFTGIRLFKH